MSGPIIPPLTVSDVADGGSVTGRPITTIEVTDGTLTVSGRTATLTTGGGGSGTVTSITNAADSGSGTAITTSGTFTYTGGTGVTTAVSGTTVTITADNNGTVTSITPAADSGSGTAITSSGTLTFTGGTRVTTSVSGTTVTIDNDAIEGTAVLSTGETAGTKFLREDGDGSCSWQAATATVPDPLLLGNGSAGAPTYSFTTDTDTGIFNVGANVLGFSGGGTKRAEISVSGMVVGSGAATGKVTTKGAYDLEITTNEGTNSGTITITQGVDGAISLTPNGDGYISFNGEYKFPIADGDANEVLTTDGLGALTFKDAGGGTAGAAQIIGVPYGFNGGTDLAILNRSPFGTIKTATKSWNQSGCQCYPFIARKSGEINTATLYVSATGGTTTGTLDFGIYSDASGVPNAKLGECSFDPTTASQQTETVGSSVTTVAGTQYWAVLVPNGTDADPSLYANNLTYEMGLGVHSSTFGEGNPVLRSASDTSLPASFTTTNLAGSDLPRYCLGVKYV